MNPITGINVSANVPSIVPPNNVASEGTSAFKDLFLKGLDQVNQMQLDADQAVEQLFTGGEVDSAEVLTAVQKADMAFRMMLQIRNKLVDAYQEIKNLRI